MKFFINVLHDRRVIRLTAELIYQTERIERFRISGRNRSIVLQSNRPVFKLRGLKHRQAEWKLFEGTITYKSLLESIIKELDMEVRKRDI